MSREIQSQEAFVPGFDSAKACSDKFWQQALSGNGQRFNAPGIFERPPDGGSDKSMILAGHVIARFIENRRIDKVLDEVCDEVS